MPSLDCIIGIAGIELENVVRKNNIYVHARVGFRPCCAHCGHFRCRIKSTFIRTLKHSKQGQRLIIVDVKSHKYYCPKCERFFNLRIPGVLPKRRSTENFRSEVYEKHHGGISQRLLSRTHGIGEATVERWYQDFTYLRVQELKARPSPKVLGIDEHFFTRKKGYATTFCDLKNRKIFDVALGRSENSLKPYLAKMPERRNTKIILMDLSETYRQIAENHFPKALIVADRFHVIRLINHSFLKAWQQLDPTGRKNRGLLSLMRRHSYRLEKEQKTNLNKYLSQHPVLDEIYLFKQKLCELLCRKLIKRKALRNAAREFHHMIEELKETSLESLQTLGKTLDRWKVEILRMLRCRQTNSTTEGFHNKMEMLSRRAFGFRNFSNYRLRVLAHCGWDGVLAIRK
jgi:transposase